MEIFSYFGGKCEGDAMSNPEDISGWQAEDVISRGYIHDPDFTKLLENTRAAENIDTAEFDAIVITGWAGSDVYNRKSDGDDSAVRAFLRAEIWHLKLSNGNSVPACLCVPTDIIPDTVS